MGAEASKESVAEDTADSKSERDLLAVDWLALCRRATAELAKVFSEHSDRAARHKTTGRGAGGDETLLIDAKAEEAVFAELEQLHVAGHSFQAISEERGVVHFGDGEIRVVVDPIDGSLNAKRGLPSRSLSIAVASGATMGDVRFGYVYDFGAGEEFSARQGAGAWLNDERLTLAATEGDMEIVALEGAKPERVAAVATALVGEVYRLRCIGSIAISLSYVAAGRCDGMASLYPCRSVDAAAAQLIAREAGAEVHFIGQEPSMMEAPLALDARYLCLGAAKAEWAGLLAEAVT